MRDDILTLLSSAAEAHRSLGALRGRLLKGDYDRPAFLGPWWRREGAEWAIRGRWRVRPLAHAGAVAVRWLAYDFESGERRITDSFVAAIRLAESFAGEEAFIDDGPIREGDLVTIPPQGVMRVKMVGYAPPPSYRSAIVVDDRDGQHVIDVYLLERYRSPDLTSPLPNGWRSAERTKVTGRNDPRAHPYGEEAYLYEDVVSKFLVLPEGQEWSVSTSSETWSSSGHGTWLEAMWSAHDHMGTLPEWDIKEATQ